MTYAHHRVTLASSPRRGDSVAALPSAHVELAVGRENSEHP